jgi:hypothetical protein
MRKSLVFMLAVTAVVLVIVILAPFKSSGPLENVDGCSMTGAANSPEKMDDNRLKNRYEIPRPEDFDSSLTLATLLKAVGPRELDNRRAARITGYIRNVGVGGVESCNCRATDEAHRDTHIEVVASPGGNAKGVVITEVTPRTRIEAARRGEDWSTQALHSKLLGKRVTIEGWVYFDPDHIDAAFTSDPEDDEGKENWRGTNWEIHPITKITVEP